MRELIMKMEPYYHDQFGRAETSIPPTEAFTDSVRGTPANGVDDIMDKSDICLEGADQTRTALPTRPVSNGVDSNATLDPIGKDVKRLMDTIQSLRHLGFENSVISLPKIVVVGDQSTGKSSVIEGISGIKVPRSMGTCTRCPLEINLASSEQRWTCKVYLSRRFEYQPNEFGVVVSKTRPYGPWEPIPVPEEIEFTTLHAKADVPDTLVLAQLATLNPREHIDKYKPGSGVKVSNGYECEFSPNVVRLDISGPHLPNLAFTDLPGMISHVSDEIQNYIPKLIENLVRDYIKSSNTIILLTVTMNHDLQNSKTAGFINRTRSEDRVSKIDDRTVAVFTKPDLMSADSEHLFDSIFSGQNFKRKLGYFAVLNNSDSRVSHAEARRQEEDFFKHWHKKFPALGQHTSRFGVQRLQEELSKLLVDSIQSTIPKIREKVDQKIEECRNRLSELPAPPSGNLSLEVAQCITDLARLLEVMFKPVQNTSEFMEQFRRLTRVHRVQLVESYPRLRIPIHSSEGMERNSSSPIPSRRTAECIQIDDDDDEDATPSTPTNTMHAASRKRAAGQSGTVEGSKRSRLDASGPGPSNPDALEMSLEQLREIMVSRDDTGLPGAQNTLVTKEVYLRSTTHWRQKTEEFLRAGVNLAGNSVMTQARLAFSKQLNTALWEKISGCIRNYIMDLFNASTEFALKCLRMEKQVFTLDTTVITPAREAALREMSRDRRIDRVSQQIREEMANGRTISEGQKLQRMNQARSENSNVQLPPDPYQAELEQMALCRGYYSYAANRYAEYVTLNLRMDVLEKCADELCNHIRTELRLDEEDANVEIRKLLEVSDETARERVRNEEKLDMLEQGLEKLVSLEGVSQDDTFMHPDSTF